MNTNLSFKVPESSPSLGWWAQCGQGGRHSLARPSAALPVLTVQPESSAVPLQLHPLPATTPKIDFTPAKGHRHQF